MLGGMIHKFWYYFKSNHKVQAQVIVELKKNLQKCLYEPSKVCAKFGVCSTRLI